jgi:MOSC domain-containing protein YiiM
VTVRTLNLDGDAQADLTVHGGINKAVYAYPSEHYDFWRSQYPEKQLDWGAFGENLTTEGLLESSAGIGDKLQVGSAILVVVQPRLPCYKLAGKFSDENILFSFTESGRSGIYFAVEREGVLQAGDAIAWIHQSTNPFTIADAMRLYNGDALPPEMLNRALDLKALPDSWRARVRQVRDQK